ncbi:polyphosphate polymerase domain-containing protein [Marinitoga litoralis]|uniref:polyphosphate polymerase domain-containing protein n=1 Tax=Marinitoga litoralis TaxID=570855 RepID=UPI00195F5541|nr:polyphosphate polymerase domain-containing protein [Marinitoga litoralis]MBM7560189.1 hypothetical protein [Marinitoga litoralis]
MRYNKYYRYELKYLINFHDYIILRNKISNIMSLDKNAGKDRKYHIRSIYFDDYLNTSYYDRINGVQNRYKYRIRYYNLKDNIIKLEKKIKKGNFSTKIDYFITKEEMLNIIYNNHINSEGTLLQEMKFLINYKGLKPVVMQDYEREAYIYEPGKVRITFDFNLRANINIDKFFENIESIEILSKDKVILEVKYEKFIPTVIRNLLQISSRQQMAISKYVLSRSIFI